MRAHHLRLCTISAVIVLVLLSLHQSDYFAARVNAKTHKARSKLQQDLQEKMRLVAISDIHGLHLQTGKLSVPQGDVLLCTGDIELRNETSWRNLKAKMKSWGHNHVAMTFGNMDHWAEEQGPDSAEWSDSSLVHVLYDTIKTVNGLRIFGSPFTPEYYGSFQLTEAEAPQHWKTVLPPDSQVDIILTHGPPYGYGDGSQGKHVGDKHLLQAVMALDTPPRLWVCGHIHAGRGTYTIKHHKGDILLVNAAVQHIERGYPELQPFILDMYPDRIDVSVGPPPPPPSEPPKIWKAPLF